MSLTILHNPKCSKSRKTLEIIREHGQEPAIVDYLNKPPTARELLDIRDRLGLPLTALLRRNEPTFRDADDLPTLDNDEALADWLAVNIRALERPIVLTDDGRAIIGRPPENVLELLAS